MFSKITPPGLTEVISHDSIIDIRVWMKKQGMVAGRDFIYSGWSTEGGEIFAFYDRDMAMLFKLTFGG